MGVAKIISHSGFGLYAVEIQQKTDRIESQRDVLQGKIGKLDKEFTKLTGELDAATLAKTNAETDIDNKINSPLDALNGDDIAQGITTKEAKREKQLRDLTAIVNKSRLDIIKIEELIKINRIKYAPIVRDKKLVDEFVIDDELREVWSIDYTLDLDPGDYVETTEGFDDYNGDDFQFINLRSEFNEKNLVDLEKLVLDTGRLATKGFTTTRSLAQIEPVLNSQANTILWNWMTLPAMQKWRPQYQNATISTINQISETCRITFQNHPFLSRIEPFPVGFEAVGDNRYNIQQEIVIDKVPFQYMECGSSVFKVGDKVVIEYLQDEEGVRDYKQPVVIGFVSQPRRCKIQHLVYIKQGTNDLIAREIGNNGVFQNAIEINLIKDTSTIDLNNSTHGRRLNSGVNVITDELGIEEIFIYNFETYNIYRNGIIQDLSDSVNFQNYVTNNAFVGFPDSFLTGWNLIIASEVYGSSLYVLAFSQWLDPNPVVHTKFERDNEGEILFEYGHDGDMRNLRIFEFGLDNYFLKSVAEVPLSLGILGEQPIGVIGSTPSKFFYFSEYSFNFPDGVQIGPNGGVLTIEYPGGNVPSGHTADSGGTLSKIFGFSIAEDFIIISCVTRNTNAAIIPSIKTNHVVILGRRALDLISHTWKKIPKAVTDGIIGVFHPSEQETDGILISGKTIISGDLIVTEPNDFFNSNNDPSSEGRLIVTESESDILFALGEVT